LPNRSPLKSLCLHVPLKIGSCPRSLLPPPFCTRRCFLNDPQKSLVLTSFSRRQQWFFPASRRVFHGRPDSLQTPGFFYKLPFSGHEGFFSRADPVLTSPSVLSLSLPFCPPPLPLIAKAIPVFLFLLRTPTVTLP